MNCCCSYIPRDFFLTRVLTVGEVCGSPIKQCPEKQQNILDYVDIVPVFLAYVPRILVVESFLLQFRLCPGTSHRNPQTVGLNRTAISSLLPINNVTSSVQDVEERGRLCSVTQGPRLLQHAPDRPAVSPALSQADTAAFASGRYSGVKNKTGSRGTSQCLARGCLMMLLLISQGQELVV